MYEKKKILNNAMSHYKSNYVVNTNVVTHLSTDIDPTFEESCRQPEQLTTDSLEECTSLQRYDYFDGSRLSHAFSFIALGVILLGECLNC